MTLAHALAQQVQLYPFTLKQPWLTFAPRRLPKFNLAVTWKEVPELSSSPDLIITTGRIAAAVGKHLKEILNKQNSLCKHVQILNPKDKLSKYDWVLIPEHDQITGDNVINFIGSIHPYDSQWFAQDKDSDFSQYLAIFVGNPKAHYFESKFAEEINTIHKHFSDRPLFFCGSPRLKPENRKIITSLVRTQDKVWLNKTDGSNPYQSLLKNAKKIFVTSDSINMINEACASYAPVSILAKDFIPSPKHARFLDSIVSRCCDFKTLNVSTTLAPSPTLYKQILL